MYCIDFEYKATNKQNYDVVSVAIEEPKWNKKKLVVISRRLRKRRIQKIYGN